MHLCVCVVAMITGDSLGVSRPSWQKLFWGMFENTSDSLACARDQVLALIVANPAGGGGGGRGGRGGGGDGAGAGGALQSVIDLTSDDTSASAVGAVGAAHKKAKATLAQACAPAKAVAARRGTTLVVCPASVMANWVEQANAHVLEAYGLQVLVHHGKSKETADGLAQADLVITSYGTLAAEMEGRAGGGAKAGESAKRKREDMAGLLSVDFHRVVLDEAHTIRNRGTKAFKACVALSSRHAWALTGTPIQNKAEDVHSLFEFVRAKPVDDWSVFRQAIAQPIRNGQPQGMARLRVLMRTLCLRRGKDILKSSLPARTIQVHRVALEGAAKEAYEALFQTASLGFESLLASGSSRSLPLSLSRARALSLSVPAYICIF